MTNKAPIQKELTVIKTNPKGTRNAYTDSEGGIYLDCTLCEETKPIENFHNKERGLLGKQPKCKECAIEVSKQWNKEHKGKDNNFSVNVNETLQQDKEKKQHYQQPQDKQPKRTLTIELDATTWKLVKMQSIFEDKEQDELMTEIIKYYMINHENSVLKW